MEKSYAEIFKILELTGESVSVFKGSASFLPDEKTPVISESARDLAQRAEEYSRLNFSNIGKSSKMIMDIIDDYLEGKPQKYEALVANPLKNIPMKQKVKHWLIGFKNEVYYNYRVRFKLVEGVYNVLRSIKKKVFN